MFSLILLILIFVISLVIIFQYGYNFWDGIALFSAIFITAVALLIMFSEKGETVADHMVLLFPIFLIYTIIWVFYTLNSKYK
jgi:hypothetical protein